MSNKVDAFYCAHKSQCRWQGFALHQGLGWGEVPPITDPWRKYHDLECGGKLIRLIKESEPSLKSQLEAVIGELEKEADNWKGKTYISFGLKFKDFANRLRELLKGQNDSH